MTTSFVVSFPTGERCLQAGKDGMWHAQGVGKIERIISIGSDKLLPEHEPFIWAGKPAALLSGDVSTVLHVVRR